MARVLLLFQLWWLLLFGGLFLDEQKIYSVPSLPIHFPFISLTQGSQPRQYDILGPINLCCWGSPGLSEGQELSGYYPPDANSTHVPPVLTTKNVFRHCPMSRGRQHHPWLRTTVLAGLRMAFPGDDFPES